MLGIAYQGQGQLDLAWDKFRQVPMSDAVMDNLYNLALDFERKRQFNKAESVFRHMHEYNPKFRDLEQKLSRAKQLSETVILGGGGEPPGRHRSTSPAGEKPKFGRFEVQKELGKGAMGVVYLGKDPKIGREVAIKTMALAQEFEAEELAEVKERFFREAETAGRLSHPNIVTIYDTGEEHDFCYIAMELLKGGDLAPYVKAGEPAAGGQGGVDRRARRRCARLRAQAGRRAPRHQAGEHDVPRRHRHAEGHRLRHRAPHRFLQDQDRHGARHALLHVARAARRQEDRGPLGPVLARGEPVPAALRQAAVRGRVDGAADVQDRQRAADRHPVASTRTCRRPGRVPRQGAGEESGRALPDAARSSPAALRAAAGGRPPAAASRPAVTSVDIEL